MDVCVDDARHDETTTGVDDPRVIGNRSRVARARRFDEISRDDHGAVRDELTVDPVEEPTVDDGQRSITRPSPMTSRHDRQDDARGEGISKKN
jgi:hypothetical protein